MVTAALKGKVVEGGPLAAALVVGMREAHGLVRKAMEIVDGLREKDSRACVITAQAGLVKAEEWSAGLAGVARIPFRERQYGPEVMTTADAKPDGKSLGAAQNLVRSALRHVNAVKDRRSEVLAARNGLLKADKALAEALPGVGKSDEPAEASEAAKAPKPKWR